MLFSVHFPGLLSGDCQLHCRISDTHFLLVGHVDDGTHCNYHNGACIGGVCYDMPNYLVATQPPVTFPKSTLVVTKNPTTNPETATTRQTTSSFVPSTQQETTSLPTPASKICLLITTFVAHFYPTCTLTSDLPVPLTSSVIGNRS